MMQPWMASNFNVDEVQRSYTRLRKKEGTMAGWSISSSRCGCALLILVVLFGSCKSDNTPAPSPGSSVRSFRMGFSAIPPRDDLALAVASVDMWSLRADAAIISYEVPWDSLLDGVSPESVAVHSLVGLANYFRFKGHMLWVYVDPANGLNRAGEADPLVRRGRSITEPSIQELYHRWVVVLDSMLHPEHLGLALETNLIRGLSPPSLYNAIRQVVNVTAADIRTRDTTVKLSISVQVDYAWGMAGGVYQGVATDFTDFPFIDELGLSSYPYLAGYATPEDVPLNYYSRLIAGHTIPVMVTEGGWSSASLDTLVSSGDEQRRYITHQAELLDSMHAIAVFQLTFTDLDLVSNPPPPGSILPLFAHLGLVDINLNPKPALGAWDAVFARPRQSSFRCKRIELIRSPLPVTGGTDARNRQAR
jgi:hypothetical protein